MTATAVHFGAGNIGRGFVAPVLRESGYDVVFADVNEELIGALQHQGSYRVREVGPGARELVVDGYRAVDSRRDPGEVARLIAEASIATTAVGPRILPFLAPLLVEGLALRPAGAEPLAVIACENAIGGTSILAAAVRDLGGAMERAVWADCAIDRIVPEQSGGLDVVLETFWEWAIDRTPFGGAVPRLDGAHWVDGLEPYIERKLFTVNTSHAATAYLGALHGADTIEDALTASAIDAAVRGALAETSALLVAKHGFTEEEQRAYVDMTLARITNPELPDSCTRVGRSPMRKISRNERFIAPAAQLAERGTVPERLLAAVGAALRFDAPDDAEAVELQARLAAGGDPSSLAAELCGIEAGHALHDGLAEVLLERLEA